MITILKSFVKFYWWVRNFLISCTEIGGQLFCSVIITTTPKKIIHWKTFKICNCIWLGAFESIKGILPLTEPRKFPYAWVTMLQKCLIIILLPDLKLFVSFGKEKRDSEIQQVLDCGIFPMWRPYNYIWKGSLFSTSEVWWKPTQGSPTFFMDKWILAIYLSKQQYIGTTQEVWSHQFFATSLLENSTEWSIVLR